MAGDPDAKVCLQLALSLGEWDGPLAGQALISLASRFSTDPFMRAAIMSSAVRHADEFVRGLAHGNPRVLGAFRESLLRQAIGRNDLPAIDTLLHEWAHALAWNYSLDSLAKQPDIDREEFDRASHDEAWGVAYSRVWRTYSVDILARS